MAKNRPFYDPFVMSPPHLDVRVSYHLAQMNKFELESDHYEANLVALGAIFLALVIVSGTIGLIIELSK